MHKVLEGWGVLIAGLFLAMAAPSYLLAQDSSPVGDTLKMENVVSKVIRHNDRAAAARFMEKSEFEKIGPSGAWDDPMLMVGVSNLPTSGSFTEEAMTMKMIGLSQKIPYAGQKGLEARAAKSQAEAAVADRRQTELDLATAARNAYLSLYYRQKALDYITAQREIQQDIVSSAVAKLQTNQASQADVAAAQSDLWRLEADILSSQQEIDAATNQLYALMGEARPAASPILVEPGFEEIPSSLDQWLAAAESNYPPLLRAKNQAIGYDYMAKASGRMRWPMLELAGSYGFRQNGPTDPMTGLITKRGNMISFQANISLPIFSGRSEGKTASSMRAMKSSAEAEASQILRDTKADLKTIFAGNQRLIQSLHLYNERIIPADEDAYSSAFAGYESNRIPFSSLLDYAKNIYRDRLAANQISFQLAQYMVQAAQYMAKNEQ